MPSIQFAGQTISCPQNANLRRVLRDARLPLYQPLAGAVHCRGLGTCGTCAVRIAGPVTEMTRIEKWRLGFPPHSSDSGLRLACQCKVLGDLEIVKQPGFWGHKDIRTS